ncbi:MAG TPA: hypothetical protein VJ828_00700 [Lacipirellulaceae bacterium]|nr:hypothetical protein [Lacipirellulaceae bacterium]
MADTFAETQKGCPKCNGAMQQGFVVDNTYGGRAVSHWAQGPPQKSFWTGTKLPPEPLPLAAFRCSSCGFTEFYAGEQFAAE